MWLLSIRQANCHMAKNAPPPLAWAHDPTAVRLRPVIIPFHTLICQMRFFRGMSWRWISTLHNPISRLWESERKVLSQSMSTCSFPLANSHYRDNNVCHTHTGNNTWEYDCNLCYVTQARKGFGLPLHGLLTSKQWTYSTQRADGATSKHHTGLHLYQPFNGKYIWEITWEELKETTRVELAVTHSSLCQALEHYLYQSS